MIALGLLLAAAAGAKVAPAKGLRHPPVLTVEMPSFDDRVLTAHNQERARLGLKPLVWSNRLASKALNWAKHQAETDTFEHDADTEDGENLWMGTKGFYRPEEMVGAWTSERALFKLGLFPKNSKTGNWMDVGHYTQLIWFNTTAVGCARVANRTDDYLVCRYDPPGNWMGQNPLGR
jgi:Cysteine-rich secretory protein family